MSEFENNVPQQGGSEPGKGAAIGSLVCGIVAIVFWWFNITTIVSVILGIVGLFLSGKSKEEGFNGGLRTAGFVLSLIGLIVGALFFVACVACYGGLACMGAYA